MELLADTPLEASRDTQENGVIPPYTFNFNFKKRYAKKIMVGSFFLEAISLGRIDMPSPKIVVNLP